MRAVPFLSFSLFFSLSLSSSFSSSSLPARSAHLDNARYHASTYNERVYVRGEEKEDEGEEKKKKKENQRGREGEEASG